jgi:hypothetical protein
MDRDPEISPVSDLTTLPNVPVLASEARDEEISVDGEAMTSESIEGDLFQIQDEHPGDDIFQTPSRGSAKANE